MKIIASVITGLFLLAFKPASDEPKSSRMYVSNYENVLGTSLEFKFSSRSEQQADLAERVALAEISRLSAIFSAYDQHSEFSRWKSKPLNTPVKVSSELFQMLQLFQNWKSRSKGALNASAALANQIWTNAASKNQLPSSASLQDAVKKMNAEHYKLDAEASTATRISDVPLVMNTFAKSYILDKAADASLKDAQVDAAIVNIGGDLVVKGNLVEQVNITNPKANAENDAPLYQLLVENKAVATSGNYRRGEKIKNHWYSHIIDPRTAMPVEGVISATVVAPNATDAGALATAFNVLSLDESKSLAEKVSGVEYMIVTTTGKRVTSRGWAKLQKPESIAEEPIKKSKPNAAEKEWDPKYELIINFELNAIAGNSHRPFAAIWVEDQNKQSVRNLALWYNKTKWVPDLRNWYRINGDNFKASKENYASVTGATRSPGKYTIKWDGKDDKGNFVAQGNYTIMIESSKEHGTDEIIRQPLELKKSAKKVTNSGNVEISNVTFDYRKK